MYVARYMIFFPQKKFKQRKMGTKIKPTIKHINKENQSIKINVLHTI